MELLRARIGYLVRYYQKMGWKINPDYILEMCAEACFEDGRNILMSAKSHLRKDRKQVEILYKELKGISHA